MIPRLTGVTGVFAAAGLAVLFALPAAAQTTTYTSRAAWESAAAAAGISLGAVNDFSTAPDSFVYWPASPSTVRGPVWAGVTFAGNGPFGQGGGVTYPHTADWGQNRPGFVSTFPHTVAGGTNGAWIDVTFPYPVRAYGYDRAVAQNFNATLIEPWSFFGVVSLSSTFTGFQVASGGGSSLVPLVDNFRIQAAAADVPEGGGWVLLASVLPVLYLRRRL